MEPFRQLHEGTDDLFFAPAAMTLEFDEEVVGAEGGAKAPKLMERRLSSLRIHRTFQSGRPGDWKVAGTGRQECLPYPPPAPPPCPGSV